MRPADPFVRRLERDAVVWAGLATVAALVVRPGQPALAAGVAGGGILALTSLWAIRSSVDALLSRLARVVDPATAAPPRHGPPVPFSENEPEGEPESEPADGGVSARAGVSLAMKLAGRYALLALGAYVMIVRLRLHAIGVLIGASSLVAAASFEAVRVLRRS
jgi:hypothetical protein